MKEVIKLFFLNCFLFSCFFLGGFIIGPVSIRIYLSIIMFIYLFINRYKFPLIKEVLLYFLFIIFYLIALLANGEYFEIDFPKYFLGRYFVCFVVIYAILRLINNVKSLNSVIKFICYIGLANALISILQFFGNSFAISVSTYFNPIHAEAGSLDYLDKFIDGDSEGVGAFGFFFSNVANGYFSVIPCLLILYLINIEKRIVYKYTYVLFSLILLFSLFVVQQRLVMVLTLGFYCYLFFKKYKILTLPLVFILVGILYMIVDVLNFGFQDLGRLQNLEDNKREIIYSLSLDFIKENLMFGGQLKSGEYLLNNGASVSSSHNFILNAFVYSGVFGAIILVYLFIKLLINCIAYLINNNKPTLYIAIALIIYLLNSLTHNKSLVTGDEVIWILFGLLIVSSNNMDENKKNENSLFNR